MNNQQRRSHPLAGVFSLFGYVLAVILIAIGCGKDYTAEVGPTVTKPSSSTNPCPCSTDPGTTTTSPGNATSSPGSNTTTSPGTTTTSPGSTTTNPNNQAPLDTLNVPAPTFSPNGGNFRQSAAVRISATIIPNGALIEYSVDNGDTWVTGQQLNLTKGAKIFARLRSGKKVSPVSSAQFNVYYERMLIIGNSIMLHQPDPTRGWLNTNGMAASAPEKDFVHLLAARLQALNPAMTYRLQSGGDFERYYSTSGYSSQELSDALQQYKPDLIVVRIGENVDQSEVLSRNFDKYYRELLDLLNYGQPVRIVCTTSVWWQNRSDPIVRKVVTEKGYSLVDLDCIVGQTQYFATQYKDKGVAEHPNDAGMQVIANMIWSKIQGLTESGCP
ncbi:hypothetical protein GCM10027592_00680 [Spirosoma flavus]